VGLESLGDLFIAIATNSMLAAGETHVDNEFWDKYSVNDPTRFAFPNLIFKYGFCAWLFTIKARTYVRHDCPFLAAGVAQSKLL
jgi:hypothetical protein